MGDWKKLVAITGELEVGKNRQAMGRYNYRNAEDILTALKPLCKRYGCAVVVSDDIEMIGNRFYVKATVTLSDADTGETIAETHAYAREDDSSRNMQTPQLTGASSSYARKYALTGMFNLSPSDEGGPVIEPDAQNPDEQYTDVPPLADKVHILCDEAGINYTDFIKTTSGSVNPSQKFLERCVANWAGAVKTYEAKKHGTQTA